MPAKRVCPEVGCPALTDGGRCVDHRRQYEKQRGRRQERGYDSQHDRARRAALANATRCTTCHEPFTADNPATAGHAKAIRDGGTTADGIHAECRRCNYGWRRTGS